MSDLEQSMAEVVRQKLAELPEQRGREKQAKVLDRLQAYLEEEIRQEAHLQSVLDRARGSNVAHFKDTVNEPPPSGLPGTLDQLERRQKNKGKHIQELDDML